MNTASSKTYIAAGICQCYMYMIAEFQSKKLQTPMANACQYFFFFHPGTDKTNRVLLGCLGLNWGCTANTSQPPNPQSPLGFWRAVYPTPSHHCGDSSPSPPHQSHGHSQLPNLTASSSASQQLRNNTRPDYRLPYRLHVCQPCACQITVSANSGAGQREG